MKTKIKSTVRSNAWTVEDDNRLAETVLQHIRNGSTQLRAFAEAGQQLGRTSAACGFRWNGALRKQHVEALEAVKAERKHYNKKFRAKSPASDDVGAQESVPLTQSETMKGVIGFLMVYEQAYRKLEGQAKQLRAECDGLKKQLKTMDGQAETHDTHALTPEQLEADTQTLMEIMGRARKLVGKVPPLRHAE